MLPYVDTALDLWDLWDLWNLCDLRDPSVPGEGARFRNTEGNFPHLRKHSIVIFDAKGDYEITGHVAVVLDVISPGVVDILEQNMSRYRRIIDVSTEEHVLGWLNLIE